MSTKMLKDTLKNFPIIGDLLAFNRKRKGMALVANSFDTYQRRYINYSVSLMDGHEPEAMRRSIIIDSHIIEKGLSHSDFRPGFGKNVVIEIQECLRNYMQLDSFDEFAVNNAVNLLREYHAQNAKNGFDDRDYLNMDIFDNIHLTALAPFVVVNNKCHMTDFKDFAKARHSVRCYSEDAIKIDEELLKKVITLANTAPSACNRQATHVFAITDRRKFKQIEEIQKGCKGFGEHVSAFLFVASDLSLYTVNEFKLPIFDAGIYTMNLLYALDYYGLHSCTLNATFPGDDTKKIHRVANIPDKYEINGLIAVYNLPEEAEMIIAASPRRNVEDILTML